ncbi:MAG: ETC complex I subunit [Alphaproteobacteria bacterium]|nr:ETC complex I subunit [Alphaproteobacteria bacterium]MBF0251096.1 ETC complex I subunit [Alphaproteobacteria bacterium]
MANARIYRPANNIMQSGKARMLTWILEFEPGEAKTVDPLMGWTGSGDTRGQVRMTFDTREEAVGYAQRAGLDAVVIEPNEPHLIKRDYAERFAYNRVR